MSEVLLFFALARTGKNFFLCAENRQHRRVSYVTVHGKMKTATFRIRPPCAIMQILRPRALAARDTASPATPRAFCAPCPYQ